MHCDDKRTLYALKENIEKLWLNVKSSDFEDKDLLNDLFSSIKEYLNYKHQLN